MQERQFDGKDVLTNNATFEDIREALKKCENKFVALHKPGSDVELSDGTKYKVDKKGTWRRV